MRKTAKTRIFTILYTTAIVVVISLLTFVAVSVIKDSGLNLLLTANNHCYDMGISGLKSKTGDNG